MVRLASALSESKQCFSIRSDQARLVFGNATIAKRDGPWMFDTTWAFGQVHIRPSEYGRAVVQNIGATVVRKVLIARGRAGWIGLSLLELTSQGDSNSVSLCPP